MGLSPGQLVDSSVVDHGFESWSAITKDYKMCTCSFYLKHAALRSKSKDWLERYEDNDWSDMSNHRSDWSDMSNHRSDWSDMSNHRSDWSDMSNHRLLFQSAIENPAKCVGTKWTSSHCNLFSP
jgi:hypothetical protein